MSKMADMSKEFLEFFDKIDLTSAKEKNLRSSRDALRKDIKNYFQNTLGENQPKFHIQGSMAMRTTVNPLDDEYDIDDGIYIKNKDIDPNDDTTWPDVDEAHTQIVDAVSAGRVVEEKDTCVRVIYSKNYHVDLPIYIKDFDNEDFIPKLAHKESGWIESDPKANTKYFLEKKDVHGDQMKRIIMYLKALKDYQETELNKEFGVSGFELTLLVCRDFITYDESKREDQTFHQTLENILHKCLASIPLIKPKVNEDLWYNKPNEDKASFVNILNDVLIEIRKALDETSESIASEIYRQIFGLRFPKSDDKKPNNQNNPVIITSATSG